jgi:curved DNA-binding protein CbpA
MDLNSPLFDRIRTRRDAKPAEAAVSGPQCDHPACKATGEFRAPMGRLREGQYFCFCLDHVREYNATYNYFNGMSDEAVLRYQKDALTGHRPTWTMGSGRHNGNGDESRDPFNMHGSGRTGAQASRQPKHGVAARKALNALGLDDDAEKADIKARYKDLVKRLHPDANGGDRSNEDRLREIINAYNVLRTMRVV